MTPVTRTLTALFLALTSLVFMSNAWSQRAPARPLVEFETTQGTFVVELDGYRAPLTVKNFLSYVESGFYDGTIFHRVIPGFMAQAGGFDKDLAQKPTGEPVVNEAGNGLTNSRGTIAMARTGAPHSGTSQFFINLVDNTALNPSRTRWGYCVFGRVVQGMEVIDKIATIPTGKRSPLPSDVPQTDVIIVKTRVLGGPLKKQEKTG